MTGETKKESGTDQHLPRIKGKDSAAHPSHHQWNKEHGAGGFDAPETYEEGECSENEDHS